MKNEKIVHLYPPRYIISILLYMFFVVLGGYNSKHTLDLKLKFSAFLSCVEVTKCVKFQIPSLMGFKVGIFRISPIILMFKIQENCSFFFGVLLF